MTSDKSPGEVHTFVFADLAGFTALTEAHGDEHAADLAEGFCGEIEKLANAHAAELIKTIGDAVLLRSASARRSIALGLEIVQEMGERDGHPVIRIGMNSGCAVERKGDWFGGAVNVAARVSGAAAGGEVLLTEATKAEAGTVEGVELEALGEHAMRNVSEPVLLYRAALSGQAKGPVDVDPVCRMAVARDRGAGSLSYEGIKFRFCSLDCAARFASNPERFV